MTNQGSGAIRLGRPLAAALVVVLLVPGAALAATSPLLSGYGGPGAGAQVIVGAHLVGGGGSGRGGGTGGGTGGGSPVAATPSRSVATPTNVRPTTVGPATRPSPARAGHGQRVARRPAASRAAAAVSYPAPAPSYLVAADHGSAGLPFSVANVLLAIAAVAALLGIALATRRVTHGTEG